MGDIYRQSSEALGPELEARAANAAARSGTKEPHHTEAGIRGLQSPPRRSLGVRRWLKGKMKVPPYASPRK